MYTFHLEHKLEAKGKVVSICKKQIYDKECIFYSTSDGVIYLHVDGETIDLVTLDSCYKDGMIGMVLHENFLFAPIIYVQYHKKVNIGEIPSVSDIDVTDADSMCQVWLNHNNYNNIIVVESIILESFADGSYSTGKISVIAKIKQPLAIGKTCNSMLHNGDSLVIATNDGGGTYDPFSLSQSDVYIHGKLLRIDISEAINIESITPISMLSHYHGTIEVIAKGIHSPISLCMDRDKYILLDGGVNTGRAVFIDSMSDGVTNLGWRAMEGLLPTYKKVKCIPSFPEELEDIAIEQNVSHVVIWNSSKFTTSKEMTIGVGDTINFKSRKNSKELNDLCHCDYRWRALTSPLFDLPVSSNIDKCIVFDEEGKYNIASNINKNIRLTVVVSGNVNTKRRYAEECYNMAVKAKEGFSVNYTFSNLYHIEATSMVNNYQRPFCTIDREELSTNGNDTMQEKCIGGCIYGGFYAVFANVGCRGVMFLYHMSSNTTKYHKVCTPLTHGKHVLFTSVNKNTEGDILLGTVDTDGVYHIHQLMSI